jgi:hypothetical protein
MEGISWPTDGPEIWPVGAMPPRRCAATRRAHITEPAVLLGTRGCTCWFGISLRTSAPKARIIRAPLDSFLRTMTWTSARMEPMGQARRERGP